MTLRKVPPVGLEPTPLAPEASALSAELRGQYATQIYQSPSSFYRASADRNSRLVALHAQIRRRKGLTSKAEITMIMPLFVHRRRMPAKSSCAWL